MTFLRIIIPLYLFDLSMIFSENRYPLFRIMLGRRELDLLNPLAFRIINLDLKVGKTPLQVFRRLIGGVLGLELSLRLAVHDKCITTCRKVGRRPAGRRWRSHRRALRA